MKATIPGTSEPSARCPSSRCGDQSFDNPFAIWADLWSAGLKTAANQVRLGEMMRDSAAVISRRTPVIAAAGGDAAAADLAELGRMVIEKQEAMRQSGLAVAGDLARLQRDAGRQWADLARASAGLSAAAIGLGSVAARQAAMLGAAATTADKAIRPFHRRARGNAKRLRRR